MAAQWERFRGSSRLPVPPRRWLLINLAIIVEVSRWLPEPAGKDVKSAENARVEFDFSCARCLRPFCLFICLPLRYKDLISYKKGKTADFKNSGRGYSSVVEHLTAKTAGALARQRYEVEFYKGFTVHEL
nr:uncharacterized protein LOC110569312 [Aotus nancymaae]